MLLTTYFYFFLLVEWIHLCGGGGVPPYWHRNTTGGGIGGGGIGGLGPDDEYEPPSIAVYPKINECMLRSGICGLGECVDKDVGWEFLLFDFILETNRVSLSVRFLIETDDDFDLNHSWWNVTLKSK